MVRALLDEDLDVRLRNHFGEDIEVATVEYMGWKGLKNGPLLAAAAEQFDVLVTMDDNLPDQQNLRRFDLAVIILRPRSKALRHLLPLLPEVQQILSEIRPGDVVRVHPPPD